MREVAFFYLHYSMFFCCQNWREGSVWIAIPRHLYWLADATNMLHLEFVVTTKEEQFLCRAELL